MTDLAAIERFDAVVDLARPVATEAIRQLFDIPSDTFRLFIAAGAVVIEFIGTQNPTAEQIAAANEATDSLLEALRCLRTGECAGLTAVDDAARLAGMNSADASAAALNWCVDGHEPIESVIATGILRACCGKALKVEQVIGEATPFLYCGRVAVVDATVGACPVRRGERVVFQIGSVPERSSGRHLAFGAGRHACPGASFARFVVRETLAACEALLPAMTLDSSSAPTWRASGGYRGLETLPLTRDTGP